jgi:hypothetical protein
MRTLLLSLSAAGLLLAASTAQAVTSPEVRRFLDDGRAAADARLAKAGVSLDGRTADVRAVVGSDGRLMGLHVVRSSGSLETDAAIEKALNHMRVDGAPPLLGGAQVTLSVGEAPLVSASAAR